MLPGHDGQTTRSKSALPYPGDRLTDARAGFDQSSQPVVSFRFDSLGARQFADITRANVGRPFAIVLDGKVLSAPVIREPIIGGSGQISGSFTVAADDRSVRAAARRRPARAADRDRGAHRRRRPRRDAIAHGRR